MRKRRSSQVGVSGYVPGAAAWRSRWGSNPAPLQNQTAWPGGHQHGRIAGGSVGTTREQKSSFAGNRRIFVTDWEVKLFLRLLASGFV